MNRSILIITPYFAPQSHAAVFRAYKLAKYLPRLGWKPYVLTVDTNYLYNEDAGLLEALPPEVEICRARYLEPTVRGVRMALGGRDRTFAAVKAAGGYPPPRSDKEPVAEGHIDWLQAGYRVLRDRWLSNPDPYWTWYRPAIREARRIIKQHKIPLVFTSANPYTCHLIGKQLQSEGAVWVADLRDPHTYCHHMHSKVPSVYAKQRRAERSAAENADAVTVASSAIKMILTDSYGLKSTEDRIQFIPTGLDEELLDSAVLSKKPAKPYLLFSGEFLPDYGDYFFRIFRTALDRVSDESPSCRILFVGRREVNEPRIRPHLDKHGLNDQVEFVDHVPQEKLYRLLGAASGALLISSPNFRWWCLYAKMVDYIALRKPVLALVPDPAKPVAS